MAVRISWNWCRASWGVSSRYEARHHRPDRADLEGRARGGCDRDPSRSVWGVVVGTGVESGTRRQYRGGGADPVGVPPPPGGPGFGAGPVLTRPPSLGRAHLSENKSPDGRALLP